METQEQLCAINKLYEIQPRKEIKPCIISKPAAPKKESAAAATAEESNLYEKPLVQYYEKRKTRDHTAVKKFVNSRYNYYRYIFNSCRRDEFSYLVLQKLSSLKSRLSGSLYGIIDGYWTGLCIGGKWGGNGGWGFGACTQLLCLLLTPTLMMGQGFVLGFLTNNAEIASLMKDYRYTIGSTVGEESVKNDTDPFPAQDLPVCLTKGDRKQCGHVLRKNAKQENQLKV